MEMDSAQCGDDFSMSESADMFRSPGGGVIKGKPVGHYNRPRFFPCFHCGKKFTIRALAVHKQTCTGEVGCCCTACTSASGSNSHFQASATENTLQENEPKFENSVSEADTTIPSFYEASDPAFGYETRGDPAFGYEAKSDPAFGYEIRSDPAHNYGMKDESDTNMKVSYEINREENSSAICDGVNEEKNAAFDHEMNGEENSVTHEYEMNGEESHTSLGYEISEENNAAESDSVIQVSIVFPPPCIEDSGTGDGQTSSPNYFVINQENEQCLASDVSSSTNGLLLLHEAGLLSMAGVKLEPMTNVKLEPMQEATYDDRPSCNQETVAQSIMLSLPHLAAKMNELNGTNSYETSTKDNCDGQPNISPYSDRRLVCAVCKIDLPWEIFGSHVIHHAVVFDSNQLKCPKCLKPFNRSAMLLIHFYKHITNKSFVCKDCHLSFQFCDDLKSHTLNEHGYMEVQPFHCYICMRRFSHPQTIINHMRIHAKETPFKCNECNRSFSQIGNLQRHMSVHRGDRPHKCNECHRSFADPATLRNHVRIHTGETPFVCKVCMRGFTQIGNLKRHMARHLQAPSKRVARNVNRICTPKPSLLIPDENNGEAFKCETNTSFFPFEEPAVMNSENMNSFPEPQQQQTLEDKKSVMLINVKTESLSKETTMAISQLKEQRRKQHWQLFPCPVCGKIYTWQHDLSIHFRIHTGEKPYKCNICDKQFAQSGAVRTHKARHHNVVSMS